MTYRERLKITLENSAYNHNTEKFMVPLKYMDWLVNQAGRVEELEENCSHLRKSFQRQKNKAVEGWEKVGKLEKENYQAMTRVHALASVAIDQEQEYKDLIEEIEKTHKTTMICANCNGSGKGPGVMARLRLINSAPDRRLVTCDMCNGYGRIKRANVDEEVEF